MGPPRQTVCFGLKLGAPVFLMGNGGFQRQRFGVVLPAMAANGLSREALFCLGLGRCGRASAGQLWLIPVAQALSLTGWSTSADAYGVMCLDDGVLLSSPFRSLMTCPGQRCFKESVTNYERGLPESQRLTLILVVSGRFLCVVSWPLFTVSMPPFCHDPKAFVGSCRGEFVLSWTLYFRAVFVRDLGLEKSFEEKNCLPLFMIRGVY